MISVGLKLFLTIFKLIKKKVVLLARVVFGVNGVCFIYDVIVNWTRLTRTKSSLCFVVKPKIEKKIWIGVKLRVILKGNSNKLFRK